MSERFLTSQGAAYLGYLICGTDPSLVSQELSALVAVLEKLDDSGLTPVEEYGESTEDDDMLGAILDACRTPPFLASRRIVVVRDTRVLNAADLKELVSYLAEPLDTTILVLVYPTKSAPAALAKAIRAIGIVIDTTPGPTSKARSQWFSDHLKQSSVHLDAHAADVLAQHLGEDVARLEGTLSMLESAFGEGTRISAEELEPFLGAEGSVAPWDLTDALDAGDAKGALAALHRLLGAGERHPLQIMATLTRHYGAMLALDGANVTDEQSAVALTKLAPFPARKAMNQARKIGHDRISRAITLLANADLDLRGQIAWPAELVAEVLVARLAQLARVPRSSAAHGPGRARSR